MNRVAIDLGFIEIYWYSITMLIGVLGGGLLTYFEVKRLKIDKEYFLNNLNMTAYELTIEPMNR